jgi:hypothetical protein
MVMLYEIDESAFAASQAKSSREFRKAETRRRTAIDTAKHDNLKALRDRYGVEVETDLDDRLLSKATRETWVSATVKHDAAESGRLIGLEQREIRVLDCRLVLKDGTVAEPCVIYPADVQWRNIGYYNRFTVGGCIAEISPTKYRLPNSILRQSLNRPEIRMGSYLPLLVSIERQRRYLVPPFAVFFECESYKGKQVDANWWAEPSEKEHRLGNYIWGSDMHDRIVVCLADLDLVQQKDRNLKE